MEEDDGDTFTIFFKSSATIEGIGSFAELEAGDKVNVDYYDFKGRHIADNVTVEDLTPRKEAGQMSTVQKVLVD